jgi:T5SS/PEP-CTERM-associated repeat protein
VETRHPKTRHPKTRHPKSIPAVLVGAMIATTARADDVAWIQPNGGSYGDGANWSSESVPTAKDALFFDLMSGGYTIVLDQDRDALRGRFWNDTLIIDLAGHTWSFLQGESNVPVSIAEGGGQVTYVELTGGGTVDIPNAGGGWSRIEVAKYGDGTLVINDATLVHPGFGSIASQPDGVGQVFVTGPTSSWLAGGAIDVGSFGDGSLTVENGGFVSSFSTNIPNQAGSTGFALVTGAGSRWEVENQLRVGMGGFGELTIANGGVVAVDNAWFGSTFLPDAVATILVTGASSALEAGNQIRIGWGNLDMGSGATLSLSDEASMTGTSILIESKGVLQGVGTVNGPLTSRAVVRPGEPTGVLFLNGDLTSQSTASMEFFIATAEPGGFGQLQVTGTAGLDGALAVDVDPAFDPAPGASIRIIDAPAGLSGQFDAALLGAIAPGETPRVLGLDYTGEGPGSGVEVVVLPVESNIGFEPPVALGAVTGPVDTGVADFDGANGEDIVVSVTGPDPSAPGAIRLLISDGSGGGNWVQTSVGRDPRGLAVADLDGVNGPDVVVANAGDDSVTVLLNDGQGAGTFEVTTVPSVGSDPRAVAIGLFNADAFPDLAVANHAEDNVRIWLNTGAGSFIQGPSFTAGDGPVDVVAGDVHNDGLPDLAVISELDGVFTLLANDGNLNFPVAQAIGVGVGVGTIDPEDLDNDRCLDFAIIGTVGLVIIENTDGTLGSPQGFPIGGNPTGLASLDADGDGDMDLSAISDVDGQRVVRVLRNLTVETPENSTLAFSLTQPIDEDEGLALLGAADLDADGLRDIVSFTDVGNAAGTGTAKLLLNQPGGGAVCAADIAPPGGDGQVSVEDLVALITGWGSGGPGAALAPPLGVIDVQDLVIVLLEWGSCGP